MKDEPTLNLAECDVVVVGGGASGMICSAALASRGFKTVLVEARGSLWWEVSWARQRLALESSTLPAFQALKDELSAAGGIKNGTVEPVIAQLVADQFCTRRGVKVLFHARPIDLVWDTPGQLNLKLALKGRTGELAAKACVDCSDNGYLTRLQGIPGKSQAVQNTLWCLTFSNCKIDEIKEYTLYLGGNEVLIRLRPGCWDDEVMVDIAYPISSHGSYPVELTFTSDLEPLVTELRRMAPPLKEAILSHVADAPWSLPGVSVEPTENKLVVSGQDGRFVGAGVWLAYALAEIVSVPFWEQSNKAINLALEIGEMAALKVEKNLVVTGAH